MMTMKKLFVALSLLLLLQNAWAIDIRDAKSQGLIGEANTGYIAAVQSPPSAEVRALIASVNSKRKTQFTDTASKTSATVEQVAYRFYELAVERTAPGNYYQDSSGRWLKK
jgi:uncharacterized protein YdbL (DUF1318 family)